MDQEVMANYTPGERLKHLTVPLLKRWLLAFGVMMTLSVIYMGSVFILTVFEPFEKRMEYFGVYPDVDVVALGAVARFWSDSEVYQPVKMRWTERIECDYKPYDGHAYYQHYVNLEVIEIKYESTKPRPVPVKEQSGWIANNRATGAPARYEFESNCRLVSNACQILKFGYRKCQQLRSEPVAVRYIPLDENRENY